MSNRRITGWLALVLGVLAPALSPAADFVLAGARVYPESMASAADGTLYIGSAGTGGIVRVPAGSGAPAAWIAPGAFQSRSTFGVFVDERRGMLWVCSDDLSSSKIASPGSGPTAIKGFDLKTGAGKVSVDLPGKDPFCNDMALARDGALYVSESTNGKVLKLSADLRRLEVWAGSHDLLDIDGIAFGADGNLYANTYGGGGFFRIEMKGGAAGAITRLATPRPLTHPDGMRTASGTTFLMVEGSGKLDRVIVAGDSVTLQVLRDGLVEPAAVAQVGNTAWVAETQISVLFDDKHTLVPKLPFRVVGINLPAP
jgi:sugar lactone lactonase YvrE